MHSLFRKHHENGNKLIESVSFLDLEKETIKELLEEDGLQISEDILWERVIEWDKKLFKANEGLQYMFFRFFHVFF